MLSEEPREVYLEVNEGEKEEKGQFRELNTEDGKRGKGES